MKNRKKIILKLFAFAVIMAIILSIIPIYIHYKVRDQIFTKADNVPAKEFAIVLGAAIQDNGEPGLFLKHRLEDALTLYKTAKVKKILLSGDNGAAAYDEISVMNNYLVNRGVPQNVIFGDYAGFDTYSTMERADKIFDVKHAVVTTQAFHLPRSLYLAGEKNIDAVGFSSRPAYGKKQYFLRESAATVKSFFDCLRNREAKFYGEKQNTNSGSNINLKQL